MTKSSYAFAAAFALCGGLALTHASPAQAFFGRSRPALACAPYAQDMSMPGLWLGHFTGGRFIETANGRVLDWRDQYSCFPTRAACSSWQLSLRRHYRAIQGYRTCLPLRGGGVPITRLGPVVTAKY